MPSQMARLKVDANMGYTLGGALESLRKLCEYGIIYAEQPVASIEDMAALRFAIAKERLPARIAADESIRKAEDPLKVARANAADLMVIKRHRWVVCVVRPRWLSRRSFRR